MKQRYFGYRKSRWNPNKRFVFKNICSACGKPMRRGTVGYLCKKCAPNFNRRAEKDMVCYTCFFEQECTARVQLGIWLRCETPDMADLERLRSIGGLDDEKVRAELDSALVGCGDRKILEEVIGESAQAIYQGGSSWIERQMSDELRVYV